MLIEEPKKLSAYSVVGHRGFPEKYPENTLVGLEAAINAGVDALELDVQATKDGELILLHDENFLRTCDVDLAAHQTNLSEAIKLSAHESSRFGDTFHPENILPLTEVMQRLSYFKGIFFVEIKSEAVDFLGVEVALEKLIEATDSISAKRVFISFHTEFIQHVKNVTAIAAGWVITTYNNEALDTALQMQPEYLICNKRKLPPQRLPMGEWEWFLYDIVDADEARQWFERGVNYIESWDPRALL